MPLTKLALALAATASLALAQPGHIAHGHRHLHKRSVSAPYSYTNATGNAVQAAVGPTGVSTSSAATSFTSTSTLTQTLTSTIIDYVTVDGSDGSAGAVAAAAATGSASAESQCGGSIYITVTDTVTVTASSSSSSSSSSEAATTSLAALAADHYGSLEPATTTSSSTTTPEAAPTNTPEATTTSPAAAPTTSAAATEEPATTAETAPSTSSPAASAPTSSYSGSGVQVPALSTKRGCLYNYEMTSGCSILGAGESYISWSANWASSSGWENATLDEYYYETAGSYVPQLWGTGSTYTSAWTANAASISQASTIMGFNEPDCDSQASLSPSDAMASWNLVYDYKSSGKTIISPCVTSTIASSGDFTGLVWLQSFAALGAQWDATGIHFYADCTQDPTDQLGYLQSFVSKTYSAFSKPIWVTEYGCDSNGATSEEIGAFLTAAGAYLESEANVAHYAAFMAADGYLLTGTAANVAGQAYVATKSS